MLKTVHSDLEYYMGTNSSYTRKSSGSYESREFGFLYENLEQAVIACTKIQSIYRGYKARQEVFIRRIVRIRRNIRRISSIEIQRHWRGNVGTSFAKKVTYNRNQ